MHAGEAVDSGECIEQPESQQLPHAWDRAQAIEGVGVVWLGALDAREVQGGQQAVRGINQGQSHCHTLWDGRSGKALGHAVTVGLLGALRADLRQVGLAVGVWDMRQEFGAFAPQGEAAAHEVTGGAHRRRRDLGLREPPAAQQHGHLVGITLVVFGLPAMHRLHRQGVSEDKGQPFLGPAIGEPIPGKAACDRSHQSVTGGRDGLAERFWGGGHMAVHQDFPGVVHDTDIQAAGMHIHAAVKWVLGGVESPKVASSSVHGCSPCQHTTGVC